MSTNEWTGAFLLTQMIEVPVYLLASRALPKPRRAFYAFGASAITHPIIWFCLPWSSGPYVPLLIIAETFAVVVEALWSRWWNVRRAWSFSLLANASSACLGFAIRHGFLYT
jgi:hypothetical protein